MKNISKYLILLAMLVSFTNCSSQTERKSEAENNNFKLDSLFQTVKIKLKSDSKSFETCEALFAKYLMDIDLKDTSLNNFYNLYFSSYNEGNPFVRLINENKLIILFDSIASNRNYQKLLWSDYYKIISNNYNYNTDKDIGGENSQIYYFKEYIEKNIIIPDSN